ncbi:MAG: translocation/assembly module TamB domain-containing protein, partial [Planctomycetota bacterium]
TVELASLLPARLLAPVFAAQDLGPGLEGPVTLRFEARHDGSGIAVSSLRVRSAPESPVEVAIDGDGALPVHWSGGSELTLLEAGTFVLQVHVKRSVSGAADLPLSFDGTLRLQAGSTELGPFQLEIGPGRLRGEIRAGRGIGVAIDGVGDLTETPIAVSLDLDEFDLTQLPAGLVEGLALRGRVTGHVRVAGSPRAFTPDVELMLTDGELRGDGLPTVTSAICRVTASGSADAPDSLLLEANLSAMLAPDTAPEFGFDSAVALVAKIRCDESGTVLEPTVLSVGGGELAIELASNLRRSQLLAGTFDAAATTLTGKVGLREFSLDKLPAAVLGLGSLGGVVTGEVALDGTFGPTFGPAALRSVRLSLRDGEIKAANLPRIEHVSAEIVGDPHELTLRSLEGTLGAGRFSARGTLSQPDALLAESYEHAKVELKVTGEDVLLYRGEGAKVRASLDVTASGTPQALAVGGEVALGRGSKYVRRISVLPDLSAHGGATANEGLRLAELPPAIGDRLEFDVAIKTNEPFEVRTSVFDSEVDVIAHLRGKGSSPRVEGTMALRRGMLRFPGANLRITSGLLTFKRAEPLFPELLVQAEGKRMGFVISMTITGRYDQPQVQLSSVPPLPPQDLIVLLTTGQLPSTLADRGAEGQARFLGGYLALEVFETYFGSDSTERGESLFDRVTVETGREVSKNGTESILVEFELTPTLSVQIERDAYEDYNLGFVLRFRFR